MGDIHDFEAEKLRRSVDELLGEVAKRKPFAVELNLTKLEVKFSCFAIGGGDKAENDQLNIIVNDIGGPETSVLGAIRITRGQWERLKQAGDALLDFRTEPD